jgi:hypothetical protein
MLLAPVASERQWVVISHLVRNKTKNFFLWYLFAFQLEGLESSLRTKESSFDVPENFGSQEILSYKLVFAYLKGHQG